MQMGHVCDIVVYRPDEANSVNVLRVIPFALHDIGAIPLDSCICIYEHHPAINMT